MADNKKDDVTGVETTGHEWDGIRELNNPLPRWWLWLFYATIVYGLLYTIAYPAWPMVNRATGGLLGYSTRGEVAEEIARVEAQNAEVAAQLAAADLNTLDPSSPAHSYGIAGGAAVFRANCSQCHGAGAAGARGYPNLLDDDWLWGGDLNSIEYTVRHGIRNEADPDARYSQMPAFGEILSTGEIAAITEYVLEISGQEYDAGMADTGAELFADNCAACHGDDGTGDRMQGAPNLTDAIWLYGGDRDTITETIHDARFGVMPPWGPRLSDAEIKAVTLYVHGLGGGEAAPEEE
ncbi:cytochrome-c oxidase, cbb3-type subunit III [Marinibacterium profundimaris]|uniref:Cbb3-type cytochrome c oxidase subunit n=1 Tax=Marinibacterium profundimaris TaxID=1679460 RepID=A0A225NS52_9RHOB|nr:cytochrome-c oxidase, cbb3-type subunit III [Marinibacterium profundimaris]OWU77673.1 cytochrome Cbb3 [Marinibacterium profundimaris]